MATRRKPAPTCAACHFARPVAAPGVHDRFWCHRFPVKPDPAFAGDHWCGEFIASKGGSPAEEDPE